MDRLHLVDTTLFYSPTSGGVRRYLNAKHAWLAAHTSGPVRAIPARTRVQRDAAENPLETTPHPNAHIGANQVMGLSN